MAIRAQAFGLSVIFYDPYVSNGHERSLALDRAVTLEELLKRADCVTLHCSLTPETTKIINADTITNMKTGSFLVNTAEWDLVLFIPFIFCFHWLFRANSNFMDRILKSFKFMYRSILKR